MRTFLIILLVIATVVGAIALYLFLTTPDEATPLRFPLTASQRDLLLRVPASAEAFALIPTASQLHRKFAANPVTRDAVEKWTSEHPFPDPWLLGGADVVAWKRGKRTSYAIRIDAFRAFLVRIWMMNASDIAARWDGTTFVINADPSPPIDARTLDDLLRLVSGLPESDVLVVQRSGARGAFPPIGRPAATTVQVNERDILITSRAKNDDIVNHPPIHARHAKGALLSATFARPPRVIEDVERLVGTNISALIDDGGGVALYDIDAGTLLPRPKGVIIMPANDESRAALDRIGRLADVIGETRDTGNELLLSFDRTSAGLYINDVLLPGAWPATRWAARIDTVRMAPLLQRLGDHRGLRFVAPRLHRAVRDLQRWTSAMEKAESIEAADSVGGGVEELRVRIASK